LSVLKAKTVKKSDCLLELVYSKEFFSQKFQFLEFKNLENTDKCKFFAWINVIHVSARQGLKNFI